MSVVVLRISMSVTLAGGYRVELLVDDGASGWEQAPRASADLPGDLAVGAPPVDPEGKPISSARARELFLSPTTPEKGIEAVGRYLFQLLDAAPVGQEVRKILKRDPLVPARDRPKHLVLLEIHPPEIAALPWELLFGDEGWLFRDAGIVFARGGVDHGFKEATRRWPLKALVVVGCKQAETIGWKDEVLAIQAAFRAFGHFGDLEILQRPTESELIDAYGQIAPDVLHFIGHGGGELFCWSDAQSRRWPLSPTRILEILKEKGAPRVAFLNACRSSEGALAAAAQAKTWSITDAFLKGGTRAVVGMQADIPGAAAAAFAKAFYEALLGKGNVVEGRLVHEAVAAARVAMDRSAAPRCEWALPTLSLLVRPEYVLPIDFGVPTSFEKERTQTHEFRELVKFVDRRLERRSLRRSLDGEAPAAPPGQAATSSSLLVLEGRSGVGKSMLVHWAMEHCSHRGIRHTCLDLRHAKTHDLVGVLRLIRDGSAERDPPSVLRSGFSSQREAFSRFNRDLNWILSGKGNKPPDEPPPAFEEDLGLPLEGAKPLDDDAIPRMFASFRAALQAAAAEQPVLVTLDQFGKLVPGPAGEYLRRHLFDAVAKNAVKGVRMIVVVTPDERGDGPGKIDLDAISPALQRVEVRPFGSADFEELAREYVVARYGEVTGKAAEARERIIRLFAQELKRPEILPADLLSLVATLDILVGRSS
jgi:hypothetical protein